MRTSDKGRAFIAEWEEPRADVYLDAVGIPTVGIGHVVLPADNLKVGDRIDGARIDALFVADLAPVDRMLQAFALEQHEHDACASLAFNIGIRAFQTSTLSIHLTHGKTMLAADQFRRWVYAKGKVLAGLAARRESERTLFLTGVYDASH